jgi:hypothetical protein
MMHIELRQNRNKMFGFSKRRYYINSPIKKKITGQVSQAEYLQSRPLPAAARAKLKLYLPLKIKQKRSIT